MCRSVLGYGRVADTDPDLDRKYVPRIRNFVVGSRKSREVGSGSKSVINQYDTSTAINFSYRGGGGGGGTNLETTTRTFLTPRISRRCNIRAPAAVSPSSSQS
jgi:hypothetical protein